MKRLKHTTTAECAAAIMAGGFQDRSELLGRGEFLRGVFLSDVRLEQLHDEPVFISVDVPDAVASAYEIHDKLYEDRRWLIPAALLNSYPRAIEG